MAQDMQILIEQHQGIDWGTWLECHCDSSSDPRKPGVCGLLVMYRAKASLVLSAAKEKTGLEMVHGKADWFIAKD